MPSSTPANGRQYWSSGRDFASIDPERQREVAGYVRRAPIETIATMRTVTPVVPKPAHRGWARATPDPEGSFEGSSSGRWR